MEAATALALAALVQLVPAEARAQAGAPMDVGPDQLVTVSGAFTSMRALIEDLCEQADVEILSYDVAEDQPARVAYENRPLSEVLESLLRRESYLVGIRPGGPSGTLVTWLRVMGENPAGPVVASPVSRTGAARTSHAPIRGAFGARELVARAFGEGDFTKRHAAMRQLGSNITRNAQTKKDFVNANVESIAAMLRDYPNVEASLKLFQSQQADRTIRGKVGEIIAAL